MVSYTVHEPPRPVADRLDRAERLVFVRDGFSWSAALFAPVWLIAHRLWWALLGYIVLSALLELVRLSMDFSPSFLTLAGIALHLLIGLEAHALRCWSLDRRGWRMLGSVSGRSLAECERRFFEAWLPSQPVIASPSAPVPTGAGPVPRTTPIIGSLAGVRS